MEWLFAIWQGFADWAAAQPVLVRVAIGSVLLSLAYALFACILAKITRCPSPPPRPHSDTTA